MGVYGSGPADWRSIRHSPGRNKLVAFIERELFLMPGAMVMGMFYMKWKVADLKFSSSPRWCFDQGLDTHRELLPAPWVVMEISMASMTRV